MNKPIIVICGPTASGKTDIASRLCLNLKNGEIISADSRQVYKYLDVGTNKAGSYDNAKRLRFTDEGVPQHLTDIKEPDEVFSAGDFLKEALKLINSIEGEGKTPVIAGGTGLYIKALVNGLAELPDKNDEIRATLNSELGKQGIEYLYGRLKSVDPESAEKNRYNPQRIIRALEVYQLTGKPITVLQASTNRPERKFLQYAPRWNREDLYSNINTRAHAMLKNGMIEETKHMLNLGYSGGCPALGGLGYKHILEYISGSLTFEETEKQIALDTRHYAKRQLTWFRSEKELTWIDTEKASYDPSNIAAVITKAYENMV